MHMHSDAVFLSIGQVILAPGADQEYKISFIIYMHAKVLALSTARKCYNCIR